MSGRFRFGTFEFHTATGELRREGIPQRLQPQPAKVLAALLERPGETVSREALQQAIWGGDTHVDFERGLNFCLAQVRSALDDSADSPRYIRTVPKRGYQFIAPVSRLSEAADPAPDGAELRPRPRWPRWVAAIALASLAVTTIVLGTFWHPAAQPVPAPVRIAVTPFDNQTGSPEFDAYAAGLSDLLVAEMTTRTRYAIIGNAAILRQARAQRDLRAIGDSLGARYVIIGQVQRDAAGKRVLAHLIRVADQAHLWVVRADRAADAPLPAETELARRISDEFALHLASAQAITPPHKTP